MVMLMKFCAFIFTFTYLGIYIFSWWFWNGINELGQALGGSDVTFISSLRDFISLCITSMLFAYIPCILAIIFSYISKKKGLFLFNLIFFIINAFFYFFGHLL